MAAAVADTTPADNMSADVLRRAAALMRERAEAATPGQWQAADSWAGTNAVLNGDGHPIAVCGADAPDHGYMKPSADRAHIASWHPVVALAVVALLDDSADEIEAAEDIGVSWSRRDCIHHALAVARAYLGESS